MTGGVVPPGAAEETVVAAAMAAVPPAPETAVMPLAVTVAPASGVKETPPVTVPLTTHQSYPIEILDPRRVEVLLESDEMARRYGSAPITV